MRPVEERKEMLGGSYLRLLQVGPCQGTSDP